MMNFLRRLWAKISNRYEGGQLHTSSRSYIPAYVQDARFDADSATREEILRKARYWERNNAIVNRLADVYEQYTVGGGLQMIPSSSDPDWNERAKVYWDESCKLLNLCNRQPFSADQSLTARTQFIDGGIFILKTKGETGFPRIQFIESHRCRTPSSMRELEGATIIDGVEVDKRTGRPIAYWIADGVESQSFRRIPADQIIHVFEPSRVGQYRELSFLYPVLNDIHDLDDLQILEQKAARQAAEISNVITNETGELSPDQLRNQRYNLGKQTSAGTETLEQRVEYIRRTTGAKTVALKNGEKFEQFKSERPSVATQGYWDFLTSKICAGVGIGKQLVFPWSMQGTVVRADLDIAAQFFKSRHAVLAAAFAEVYIFVMEYGIKRDVRISDPPPDWRNVSIRPPRAVNVDNGRNSSAMLAELAAGATTYEDIYSPQGHDWKDRIRQKAKEVAFMKKVAAEEGVEPGEIAESMKVEVAQPVQEQQTQTT